MQIHIHVYIGRTEGALGLFGLRRRAFWAGLIYELRRRAFWAGLAICLCIPVYMRGGGR